MAYALLVYDRGDSLDALSPPDREAVYGEYEAFARTAGVTGYRLQPPATASTLRIEGGERELRPGPATAPELAGFYLLATDDPAEALELAARIPAARLGGAVTIHPLREAGRQGKVT
jgi:hypothetical protein